MPFLVPAIGFSAMTFIVMEIFERYEGLPQIFVNFKQSNWLYFIVVLLLMPFNWLVESLKWGKLVDIFQVLTLKEKYLSTLYGVSASILTPNRIGDYGGRLRFIRKGNRLMGIYATIIASFYQTIVTLFFGTLGLLYYIFRFEDIKFSEAFYAALVLFIIGYFLLLVRMKSIIRWILRFKFVNNYSDSFSWFLDVESNKVRQVLGLAILRYGIFLLQVLFIFNFFVIGIPVLDLLSGIAILYLFTTIIPSGFVTDLIIRGAAGLLIFNTIVKDEGVILWSITLIWMINLAIPAFFGGILYVVSPINKKSN